MKISLLFPNKCFRISRKFGWVSKNPDRELSSCFVGLASSPSLVFREQNKFQQSNLLDLKHPNFCVFIFYRNCYKQPNCDRYPFWEKMNTNKFKSHKIALHNPFLERAIAIKVGLISKPQENFFFFL